MFSLYSAYHSSECICIRLDCNRTNYTSVYIGLTSARNLRCASMGGQVFIVHRDHLAQNSPSGGKSGASHDVRIDAI